MVLFFGNANTKVFAVQISSELSQEDISKLVWLFGNQPIINTASIDAFFVGPRAAMITPWSTNATEITQNMGITGVVRIEEFQSVKKDFTNFDPMLAKVISHSPNRTEAALTLANALENLHLAGVTTNRDFLTSVLRHDRFLKGDTTTDFIEENSPEPKLQLTENELDRSWRKIRQDLSVFNEIR